MKKLLRFRLLSAFTLVEVSIVMGAFVLVGATAFILLSSGLNLFARNHTINMSSQMVRSTLDRMTRDLHASIESPTLVDASGAAVTATGTAQVAAAGIKFKKFITGPVRIPAATTAGTTSVTLNIQATDRRPAPGQFLVIPASTLNVLPQDVYARISTVTGTATAPTCALAYSLGNYLSPAASSGTVSPANTVAFIVQEVSYVVATPPSPAPQIAEMRFYSRARSVAVDGAAVFHNPANYTVVTPNMITTPTPFRTAAGDRALSIQFTAQDARYTNRIKTAFSKTLSIGSSTSPHTIPYKSLGL